MIKCEIRETLDEKRALVAKQFKETTQGNVSKVTCYCGCCIPLRFAFKCFFCDEYYCATCAKEHFKQGKK